MVANLPFNPLPTTNAAGSFSTDTTGYIQGTMLDDPAIRNFIAGGVLANSETIPMWGGVGIYEDVPSPSAGPAAPGVSLGGNVGRANSLSGSTALTGFSVFNQAHNFLNTPQSPVPMAGSGMGVNFFRLGSGARIAVAIDPSLATLEGGIITQQVSWDFSLQRLIPFVGSYPANAIVAASWASTAGGTVTMSTTTNHGVAVGDDFTIAGMTPAGYNGTFTALAGTTGSVLVFALPTNPGVETALGTLVAGGGALNVKILEVAIGNSMTVNFNSATGFATWNRSGSCAIIQI